MMELEAKAFDPSIQADSDIVLRRFALGHGGLAARDQNGMFLGAICFSAVKAPVDDYSWLPPTFKEYSTQPVAEDADTLCLYSLGVVPAARGMACVRLLVASALDEARRRGFRQAVADGPMPSLAGNDQVAPRLAVRRMIERYLETGRFPEQSEFLEDPVLALYHRLTSCRFVRLLPDFLPEDTACEGWRVLLQADL